MQGCHYTNNHFENKHLGLCHFVVLYFHVQYSIHAEHQNTSDTLIHKHKYMMSQFYCSVLYCITHICGALAVEVCVAVHTILAESHTHNPEPLTRTLTLTIWMRAVALV